MQKILSVLRKTVQKYNLIEDGDKIAVGLSGGKDSMLLLKALKLYQKFSPQNFDLIAVNVDIYSGEEDLSQMAQFCKDLNVEFIIEKTDIKKIVFDIRKEKNPCSLCAKMRRGALNSVCNKTGCNKLALGHHLDDVINTFFMSLLYEGRLSTMHPKSYMSNSKITLIRPLYLCEEKLIKEYSKDMPIFKSKCPADYNSKRSEINKFVSDLYKTIPESKKRITHAILSPESYNLLG